MSANKQRSPRNFFIIWAIFGLSLVLLSSHFTAGPYAKYISQSTGSDGARVIKFGDLTVTETGDFTFVAGTNENKFVFTPGVDLEKDIRVSFEGSEASTIVFITIKTEGWTVTDGRNFTDSQGQLTWSVDNGWTYLKAEGGTYVYYKSLAPNETMDEVQFVKEGKIQVSPNGTVATYYNYPDTSFTVKGYVVQANKFNTAADAWASISSKS